MSQTPTTGIVNWYDRARGYGFIKVDGVSQGIFVHHAHLVDARFGFEAGDRVRFVVIQGTHGRQADKVQKIDNRRPLRNEADDTGV